jgi:hypothetical protein
LIAVANERVVSLATPSPISPTASYQRVRGNLKRSPVKADRARPRHDVLRKSVTLGGSRQHWRKEDLRPALTLQELDERRLDARADSPQEGTLVTASLGFLSFED